jgi:GNAT superfamily N-acetyltransferase
MPTITSAGVESRGIRFAVQKSGQEVGRAYLYIMRNDLHQQPFGLMEDVFVNEESRGSRLGSILVERVMQAAREAGCYKLIATSRHERPRVHELYKRLGFSNHGLEFRIKL